MLSLQLPLDFFTLSFPVGGVCTRIWAPINSVYRLFPLRHTGVVEQDVHLLQKAPWVLQLGCGSFFIAGESGIGSISIS